MYSSRLGWTPIDTQPPTHGRIFQRPLDVREHALFWDGRFNGTTDTIQHVQLRLAHGTRDAHVFAEANIVRAWLSTKRRYPLVGATVHTAGADARESTPGSVPTLAPQPHFVVREDDLAVLGPHEIVFGEVKDAEEVQGRVAVILNGPRPLSDALLVQLYVFREAARTDVLHLMSLIAHCVTDGAGNNTFMRCLLDTLARGGGLEPAQIPLEERLAMAIPPHELKPGHLRVLSPARRRWRNAASAVIFQLRMAKAQGGHTLPCRVTPATPYVAARSGRISTLFTREETMTVMANCRSHNLTFGNAYRVLAQVAMTRVLCRRYLRGEISDEEWTYRKRQPLLGGTPVNLRPYLDREWFGRGGAGEFMVSISFVVYQLPFMTLGRTAEQSRCGTTQFSDGAPPFSELLTFDRFLHRAGLVKRQITTFSEHPLFYEIAHAASLARVELARQSALRWMQHVEASTNGQKNPPDEKVLAATDMPVVFAHIASSVGDVDLTLPSEYPLPRTHPLSPDSVTPHPMRAGYATPRSEPDSPSDFEMDAKTPIPSIVVETSTTFLHTRPGELYLGAATWHGQLNTYVFYDSNVFEDEIVKEWLDEVRGALMWYLGQTHWPSRGAMRQPGVRTKL